MLPFVLAATVTPVPAAAPPPARCEAHIASKTKGTETILRCGESSAVGADDAVGWIETAEQITPFMTPVARGGAVNAGPLTAAGRVSLPADFHLQGGESLSLISLAASTAGGVVHPLFIRPFHPNAVLRMPVGKAIGVVFDRAGRAVAVSPVINVRGGTTTALVPERLSNTSGLVAVLERPHPPAHPAGDAVALTVIDANGAHAPDATVSGADAVIAVWSRLEGGTARLQVSSDTLGLATREVPLPRRDFATVREKLVTLPSLTVAVAALPSGTKAPAMSLELHAGGDVKKPLRKASIAPGARSIFEHLPAEAYDVVVNAGGFRLARHVDLSDGADGRVDLTLEPISVAGTVYSGNEPARAEIRFDQQPEPVRIRTDDDGRYAVVLWAPQRYVVDTVLLDKPSFTPFRQTVRIDTSQTLDIRIPDMRFAARVYDAGSGAPVADATIIVHSSWNDEDGKPHSLVQSFESGNTPLTLLPPQRPGTVEVRVRAKGYAEPQPLSVNIDASVPERVVDIALRPAGDTLRAVILLPSGAAASGADVAATGDGTTLVWRAQANADGIIEVPKSLTGARLIVRHASAGTTVFDLPLPDQSLPWHLSSLAPPLTVHVVNGDGTPVGPAATLVTLWISGMRLTGAAAGFATWSIPATSPDGSWIGRNLPAAPTALLITRAPLRNSSLDALAQPVPYPWPALVTRSPVE